MKKKWRMFYPCQVVGANLERVETVLRLTPPRIQGGEQTELPFRPSPQLCRREG